MRRGCLQTARSVLILPPLACPLPPWPWCGGPSSPTAPFYPNPIHTALEVWVSQSPIIITTVGQNSMLQLNSIEDGLLYKQLVHWVKQTHQANYSAKQVSIPSPTLFPAPGRFYGRYAYSGRTPQHDNMSHKPIWWHPSPIGFTATWCKSKPLVSLCFLSCVCFI